MPPRVTKSLWEIINQATVVIPGGNDQILTAPEPGTDYLTQCQATSVAGLGSAILGSSNIASSTYAPALTPVVNITSVVLVAGFQWLRIANVVAVSGMVTVELGAAGIATVFEFAPPVPAVFASAGQVGGTGAIPDAAGNAAAIFGDSITNLLRVEWVASAGISASPATHGMTLHATFVITP